MKALQTQNGNLLLKVNKDLYLYTNMELLPIRISNKKEYKWLKEKVKNEIEINETTDLLESYKNIDFINYVHGNVFGFSISDWSEKSYWFYVLDGDKIHTYKGYYEKGDWDQLVKETYFNFLNGNTNQYNYIRTKEIKEQEVDVFEKDNTCIYHNSFRSIVKNHRSFYAYIKGVKNPITLELCLDTGMVQTKYNIEWEEYSGKEKHREMILQYFNGKKIKSKIKRSINAKNGSY